MTDPIADRDPRSDAVLVSLYHSEDLDLDGRALQEVYRRHAGATLEALKAHGLTEAEAKERVGAVFLGALYRAKTDDRPLPDLLLLYAAEVARDPNWRPAPRDPAFRSECLDPAAAALMDGSLDAAARRSVRAGIAACDDAPAILADAVAVVTELERSGDAPLSHLEAKALQYIIDFLIRNTFQPSFREIAAHLGFKSTKQVYDLLLSLQRKGRIERVDQQSRSIRLLGIRLHVTPSDSASV